MRRLIDSALQPLGSTCRPFHTPSVSMIWPSLAVSRGRRRTLTQSRVATLRYVHSFRKPKVETLEEFRSGIGRQLADCFVDCSRQYHGVAAIIVVGRTLGRAPSLSVHNEWLLQVKGRHYGGADGCPVYRNIGPP